MNFAIQHDSCLCRNYRGYKRPFPTQRPESPGNFVGFGSKSAKIHLDQKCPRECSRPKNHTDWGILLTYILFVVALHHVSLFVMLLNFSMVVANPVVNFPNFNL